jgi:hypothetical protein
MRRSYCILNVLGDVLDDGELHFVEAARTLEAARRRIKTLGKACPGEYVIYNPQTGERLPIEVGAERAIARWRQQGDWAWPIPTFPYNFRIPSQVRFETSSPRCSLPMSTTPERRQSKRLPLKQHASLIFINFTGRVERLPCLIVDRSQDDFRLHVSSGLRLGQLVDLILDEAPFKMVRCSVVWIGEPGSKQEGQARLQTVQLLQSSSNGFWASFRLSPARIRKGSTPGTTTGGGGIPKLEPHAALDLRPVTNNR